MEPASTAPGSARPRLPRQHPCSAGWMLAGAAMGVASLARGAEGAAVAGGGYSSGRARVLPAVGPAAFIQRAPGPVAGRSWAFPRHHQHHQHQQHRCGAPVARGSGMWRRKPRPFELAPLAARDADAGATDAEPSSLMTTLRNKVLFGVEPSPDVAAILTVYFVQGAIGAWRGTGGGVGRETSQPIYTTNPSHRSIHRTLPQHTTPSRAGAPGHNLLPEGRHGPLPRRVRGAHGHLHRALAPQGAFGDPNDVTHPHK